MTTDTLLPTSAEGADPTLVGPALAAALHDERWAACTVARISGGYSNLTYAVTSAAGQVVLRRPPLGHVLPTAHDMAREHRVLSALRPTAVPVPRTLLLAGPEDALGVPFYVMERVVGHVCRDRLPAGYAATPQDRQAIGAALIDVLAELHTIDPATVGLGDLGRPAGFMERQLRRWTEQWARSRTADLPELDRLRDDLAAGLPAASHAAIVHGDYRLDNVILHPTRPGEIVAVLDWEMSTLGDPLSDLGALLAYWAEDPEDERLVRARLFPPVSASPGFPDREALVRRYAERTGFDVSGVRWYWAFGYFKLAIVCQGIAARAAAGAMPGSDAEESQRLVEPLVAAGRHVLDGLPPSAGGTAA